MSTLIKGIAWNHSRAFPPLVATAQRYEELHPDTRIQWEKRSLDEFGHQPIDQMVEAYDLIIIDHPWAGFCFQKHLVLDLKPRLSPEQWRDLETNSIGKSFTSYYFQDKLMAVPIDAATPSASYRQDLLQRHSISLPDNWDQLVLLADQKKAVMPAFGADLFLNWSMLVEALEGDLIVDKDQICKPEIGRQSMELLKRLSEPMPDQIYDANPIQVAEWMTQTDEIFYCPFAYSYNNYCRESFCGNRKLSYAPLVTLHGNTPLRSIIGGTGIAISSQCKEPQPALDYALFTGSRKVQSGIYSLAGGQPSRRDSWRDLQDNPLYGGFYQDAFSDQERALIRPRYSGYVPLQSEGGIPLQQYLKDEISLQVAWDSLNQSYRKSRSL